MSGFFSIFGLVWLAIGVSNFNEGKAIEMLICFNVATTFSVGANILHRVESSK